MDIEQMNQEMVDLRERLVRIETNLEHIQRAIEKDKPGAGTIIVPVGLVVTAVEVIKILVERTV